LKENSGRRRIVCPSHQAAGTGAHGGETEGLSLLGRPAVDLENIDRSARPKVEGDMLAAPPFEIEALLFGILREFAEEGLVKSAARRKVNLRELHAVAAAFLHPVQQFERIEV
jgi:hypothetical protein